MSKWNQKNPAIRRILADIRELQQQPSSQYVAKPVEDNMFDWHFTIRGPSGTDFEGGQYHGRILLPSEWPFKPPNIVFLTPNGRWVVREKICLSISAYHPEHWQPAWGIRTILEALISFMNTPADGAVGALDYSAASRTDLAKASLSYIHDLMPELPDISEIDADNEAATRAKFAEQVAQLHVHKIKSGGGGGGAAESAPTSTATSSSDVKQDVVSDTSTNSMAKTDTGVVEPEQLASDLSSSSITTTRRPEEVSGGDTPTESTAQSDSGATVSSPTDTEGTATTTPAPTATTAETRVNAQVGSTGASGVSEQEGVVVGGGARHGDVMDSMLSLTALGLVVAIVAILYRKALAEYGVTN